MRLLILGRGKTGALVADLARARRHHVRVVGAQENNACRALTPEALADIEACLREKKNMVVGTTGWHSEAGHIRADVERAGIGFLYGANFSIGVNLFYDIVRTSAEACRHEYHGQIFERHHQHKKDAPSGTAAVLRRIIQECGGKDLEITSFREGEVVGLHEVTFDSPADRIYLCHDAKSRKGFAEGAVLGAEWLGTRRGFFEFKDIWREL